MNPRFRRILSALLALTLLISACPIMASASDLPRENVVLSGQMQNPLYPSLPQESLRPSQDAPQTVMGDGSYVSIEEATALIRDGMTARLSEFTVRILSPEGTPDIKNVLFPGAYSNDIAQGSTDGDYLRWSWKHISYSGTVKSGGRYSFTFTVTYYTTAAQEQAVLQGIDEALESLGVRDMTDYQKIQAIYGFICRNTDYAFDALDRFESNTATTEDYLIYTAYGALCQGSAVCQGYACLLYAMCRSAGLPVRIIHSSNHAWNIVRLGELWYNLDVTWDGQDTQNRTNYFLKGSGNFSGHPSASEFLTDSFQAAYPISSQDYVLTSPDRCYPHSFGKGVMTVPACTGTGTRVYTCGSCGYQKAEQVAQTGHHHVETRKDATCTESGGVYYVCSNCGDSYPQETTPALGHKYSTVVTPATCTAGGYTTHSCIRCGSNYTDSQTAATGHSWDQGKQTLAPTETREGEMTYTCITCSGTRKESIPTLDHSYDQGVITTKPSCSKDGVKTYTCTDCGKSYTVPVPALDHSWDSGKVTTEPTQDQQGVRTFTCTVCGNTKTEPIAPITTHHLDAGTIQRKATCRESGLILYRCTDTGCGYTFTEELPVDPKGHHHKAQREEPSCSKDGAIVNRCEYCGDSYTVEVLPALGHDYSTTTKEPTCTTGGTKVETCKRCGKVVTTNLSAKGHSYVATVQNPTCQAQGFTLHTCRNCGDSYRDSYTAKVSHEYRQVTVPPTCTVPGYVQNTCIYCQGSYQSDAVPAKGHRYGAGVAISYATSSSSGTTEYTCLDCGHKKAETHPPLTNPFRDVASNRFYYEPVLWAANYGITAGITATTFEPESQCTRAQVVTFLWRAAGKPQAKNQSCPFTDVNNGTFYYDAMLWAVEEGITVGMSATTFEPEGVCTRAQVVTFLWRAAGKPQAKNQHHSFIDVNEKAFYRNAMLWAVEQNITKGDGSPVTFNPEGICTRGQVVTFLRRSII